VDKTEAKTLGAVALSKKMVIMKKDGKKPGSAPKYLEEKLTYNGRRQGCRPNPWVSLRCDQLIPVNKAVNEKEQSEKGLEEEEKNPYIVKLFIGCKRVFSHQFKGPYLEQKV
jgi:hypothetical protein